MGAKREKHYPLSVLFLSFFTSFPFSHRLSFLFLSCLGAREDRRLADRVETVSRVAGVIDIRDRIDRVRSST